MNVWAQELHKSELRVNSYEGLKLNDLIVINLIRHGPICNYKKFNMSLNVKLHGQRWLSQLRIRWDKGKHVRLASG
jgi:hypothetical protein